MPLQNRVNPFGEVIADASRGTFMGNRGIIHDANTKSLLTRRWQHKAWICCVLAFKDFQHPIMGPSAYTELFFLDEATALAAGHRPCAYCRRKDFNAFKSAWIKGNHRGSDTPLSAPEMDKVLHRERTTRSRQKVTYKAPIDGLPDGVMINHADHAALVVGDTVYSWSANGYKTKQARPVNIQVTVLTPRSIVSTIAAGYVPIVHSSIRTEI